MEETERKAAVNGTRVGGGRPALLHTGMPIRALLQDEAGHAVLEKHLPEVLTAPELTMAMELSPEQIASFVPSILTPAKLQQIDADLSAV